MLLSALSADWAILLATLIVSAATLIYGVIGDRESRLADLETLLNSRIEDLTRELESARKRAAACEERAEQLAAENLALMRRLMRIEETGK